MKQIIPFKKELLFKTKVSEITSISLEHTLTLKNEDLVSGEFHITGDYKMTEGSIHREKFSFQLPFEIAMDSKYDTSSIIIDIDNFYYEIINNESLQVNIDVYIEGEKLEPPVATSEEVSSNTISTEENKESELPFPDLSDFTKESEESVLDRNLPNPPVPEPPTISEPIEPLTSPVPEKSIEYPKIENIDFETDLMESIPTIKEPISPPQTTTAPREKEFNLFENIDNSDTYVTYHVYIVKETDTIDSILTKYEVTKESLALYNNLEEIKPGAKLIIPN